MCIGLTSKLPAPNSPCYDGSENEEVPAVVCPHRNRQLSRQMSMSETPRDAIWERRRRQQVLRKEHRRKSTTGDNSSDSDITDEDLSELKACIELGFGFKEEKGQELCNTLPALDLYFAVNRQLSSSPRSTLQGHMSPWSSPSLSPSNLPSPSGSTTSEPETWKICSPGEDPQQVKIKLRHWAQAVACSLMQSY
ncbi:uncharacterized protein LOC116197081 [Punica granatum]|uniref:Uncharacterized protein n=2 Tax=Punica granatum TaxID=22663 RepID=A0A218WI56_PUNGR|nr:uncharacterized protein LOC116197081 [Punica granatum]OWM71692.1 hypothetical protein CDL15_Pgr005880 [Punica granatum]PKI59676.1 hypothetical protein CRG98_019938 [Punica granatum]